MSQISPDGQYVVTTINDPGTDHRSSSEEIPEGPYTELLCGQFQGLPLPPGFLSDSGDSGMVQPHDRPVAAAPGADDPQYVQASAVWSPDGKYLVFARALARTHILPARGWQPLRTIRTRPDSIRSLPDSF